MNFIYLDIIRMSLWNMKVKLDEIWKQIHYTLPKILTSRQAPKNGGFQ